MNDSVVEFDMFGPSELGHLSDDEYADLNDRVDRFHTAWKIAGSAQIVMFLPDSSKRHRRQVLVALIKTDMELRAKVGLTIRVEHYLHEFGHEFDTVPISLIIEEFALRKRYGDHPRLDDYRSRFPTQFDAIMQRLESHPPSGIARRDSSRSIGVNDIDVQATPTPDHVESTRIGPQLSSSAGVAHHGMGEILPADMHYRLIRLIGRGAFGEVFEAEAPGGFRVALKRMLRNVDHLASQGEFASLDVLKSMAHPFLLQTHAYWVFQDRLIIVMELAEGSLADRIKFHQANGLPGVPPTELIPYFEQAAQALDYLHSQKVTHRDIKPENLLHIKGYAKVADFGLTRLQDGTVVQLEGEVGTPLYMAPEVWSQHFSIHSDQYSLAATYIQARLGRSMFGEQRLSMHQAMFKHLNEVPQVDQLPEAERLVLLKALAKKPADRYVSCQEFVKALRTAILEKPIQSTRRRAIIVATLAGLTLCSGGYFLKDMISVQPSTNPPPIPPPPPPRPWCPQSWRPVNPEQIVTLSNGKILYSRLEREVAGTVLRAILIEPANATDPPAFYMLENKVTNHVFSSLWKEALGNTQSTLSKYLRDHPHESERYFPEDWKNGAFDRDGQSLGINGKQAGVPVVGITAPQAMIIAEELGGTLPSYRQWLRATDVAEPGPAGGPRAMDEDLSQRPLALMLLDGPWPVEKPTIDLGVNGVHQLTSNGFEWTRTEHPGDKLIDLRTIPAIAPDLRITGLTWEANDVLTKSLIRSIDRSQSWLETRWLYGFRIVLDIE